MRRLALVALALASAFMLSSVVAEAAAPRTLSYSLRGSAVWGAESLPPSFEIQGRLYDVRGKVAGTYEGTLYAGAYNLTSCTLGPSCAPATGTVTFTLNGGSFTAEVQPGSLVTALQVTASHESYVFDPLVLSITSGTHAYARAHGTLSLYYDTTRFTQELDPVTGGYCSTPTCPILDGGTLAGEIAR